MVGETSSIFEGKMRNPTDSGASSHGGVSKRKLKGHHYNGGRCYHGLEATVLKSHTTEYPNRWFLRCPHYKVDEVPGIDIEKYVHEKNLSHQTYSWEDNGNIGIGSFREDAKFV
ncbi:hypothetical protein PIB30_068317 [Stylosanthes scabra]|uniref:Uncharacterized protein n=1 Tax=Stylosanthes scabra TaxID=79078 RepID=A0ABU6SN10_9FABA|nr:hypothetical protein [Stylosanthes scabra]